MRPPAVPNITFPFDFLHHLIHIKQKYILYLLDNVDNMIRLSKLLNIVSDAAFHAFLSRRISIFHFPVYTVASRGSNLASAIFKEGQILFRFQLCRNPTEPLLCLIRSHERSYDFMYHDMKQNLKTHYFRSGKEKDR